MVRTACVLFAASFLGGRALACQDSARAVQHSPYFRGTDAAVGVVLAATTIALIPADERIAKHLQASGVQTNNLFRGSSTAAELLAIPGAYVVTSGLWVIGRVRRDESLMDVAVHTTEGMLVAGAVTEALKGLVGRARPGFVADTNARDLKFGAGFVGEDRSSFPSLHTATAFAAAAGLSSEISGRNLKAAWIASPILYTAATLSGLSRLYHDKHWASDVAAGATLGTFIGLSAVRYAHNHPRNAIDRLLVHVAVAPALDRGLSVVWSLR